MPTVFTLNTDTECFANCTYVMFVTVVSDVPKRQIYDGHAGRINRKRYFSKNFVASYKSRKMCVYIYITGYFFSGITSLLKKSFRR